MTRVRVKVRVEVRVRTIFERRSGDRTQVDGVCDFEKVPPDQLCLRARVRGMGKLPDLPLHVLYHYSDHIRLLQ